MKLFSRYNRLNILSTVIIFIVGGCVFYVLLHGILVRQVDSTLQSEQQEIYQYVKLHSALPEIINTKDQHDAIVQGAPAAEGYETTEINDAGQVAAYRSIHFNVQVAKENYIATVSRPLKGTQLLLSSIILVTLAMIALILLVGLFINRQILSNIWQPFYNTVHRVQHYNLLTPEAMQLQQTDVEEFTLLNLSITGMMNRVQQDYEALKKFTGHAAHEMQTPLAVIRTRIDMLMQQEAVLHEYGPGIAEIEQAVQRLSRLNQSLLLLTKVENRQFALNEDVAINDVVNARCAEFAEMLQERKITLSLSVEPLLVKFHQQLAEILVGNLVNNAMRYNKDGGKICIVLADGVLTVKNTSTLPALDTTQVFHRFYRHNNVQAEGNGLGLSIVKQICDFAGFITAYVYEDEQHKFIVDFNTIHNN